MFLFSIFPFLVLYFSILFLKIQFSFLSLIILLYNKGSLKIILCLFGVDITDLLILGVFVLIFVEINSIFISKLSSAYFFGNDFFLFGFDEEHSSSALLFISESSNFFLSINFICSIISNLFKFSSLYLSIFFFKEFIFFNFKFSIL